MKKRILLVDDHKEYISLLRIFLRGNFEVKDATGADQAIKVLHDGFRADLIITDLWMHGIGGDGLIAWLEQHSQFNTIPVIVITGTDLRIAKEMLQKPQVFKVLHKPTDVRQMRCGLNRVIHEAFNF